MANINAGNAIQTLTGWLQKIFEGIGYIIDHTPIIGNAASSFLNNTINSRHQIEFFKQLYKLMKAEDLSDKFIVAYLILLSFMVPCYIITKVFKIGFSDKKSVDFDEETIEDEITNKGDLFTDSNTNNWGLNELESKLLKNVQGVIAKTKHAETDLDKDFKLSKILIYQTLKDILVLLVLFLPYITVKGIIGYRSNLDAEDISTADKLTLKIENLLYLFLTIIYLYFLFSYIIIGVISINRSQEEESA
jgi:hypothetical protein